MKSLTKEGKIAVASSVIIVFTVASILFFIVGFLCGHFGICRKKERNNTAEGVAVPPKEFDQELELQENVAYGPLH